MATEVVLKRIHWVATIWLMACVGYLLAMSLHQVGLRWWLVLSRSGHSAVAIVLLVGLHLFVFFRGAGKSQRVKEERPLTSTYHYLGFYVSAPLLGSLAATVGMIGTGAADQFLFGVALGTLGTTFLVWIAIDPRVGMIEMLWPAGGKHRAEAHEGPPGKTMRTRFRIRHYPEARPASMFGTFLLCRENLTWTAALQDGQHPGQSHVLSPPSFSSASCCSAPVGLPSSG